MDLSLTKEAVEISWPQKWTRPIIFSSPHSGSYYPDSFIEQSDLDLLTLRQSEDYLVDELFSAATELGAPLLKSNYPRAYCDPNRQPFELDPSMFNDQLPEYVTTCNARISAGIGTIPKVVSVGKNIYASPLDFAEAEARLNLCYFPYHAALENLLREGIKKFGKVFLIDCHSMPAVNRKPGTKNNLADFILGDRFGNSCPSIFSTRIAHILKSQGYSVFYNSPYAGGFITEHYSSTIKEVSAIQIEINRDLYMNQATLTASPNMPTLKFHISAMIKEIGALFDLKKAG